MGATRKEPNDEIYARYRARYLKNRERLLADAAKRYAEEKPSRDAALKVARDAARQFRLLKKRRARYGEKYATMPEGRYESAIAFIRAYKEGKPCLDCQRPWPSYVLEFDHVRGTKRCAVSNCKTVTAAQAEILKCDLVCANCHRIRTFTRAPLLQL